MGWLKMAEPHPMTYRKTQVGMRFPMGIVLHTTNHTKGEESIHRFQRDWQAAQRQSAHFVIDRSGTIGQCRATEDVAWHINASSTLYYGVEHIAKPREGLTTAQIEASAELIAYFAERLGFPIAALSGAGSPGVGVHVDFASTGCGQAAFWAGTKGSRTGVFNQILEAARGNARFGLFRTGER